MRSLIELEENGVKTINVSAAVIEKDGKYLVTQRGYGAYKDWWEFPGGKIEAGETAEDACMREIREELAAEISVLKKLGTAEYDYPEFHIVMECFLCRLESNGIKLLEHDGAKWLSKREFDSVRLLPADIIAAGFIL